MASERQAPDAVLASTALTGGVGDIDDDPDSPDANWMAATGNNVNTDVRTSFPTPTGDPTVGVDSQEFKIQVRQYDGGQSGTPDARTELWENGGLIRAGSDVAVTSDVSQLISFTWNANEIGTSDGSLVECKVVGTKSGGSPSSRNTVDVGAVEWNVEYDEAPPAITGTGAIQVQPATLAAAGKQTFSGTGAESAIAALFGATAKQSFIGSVAFSGQPAGLDATAKQAFGGTGAFALLCPSLASQGLLGFSSAAAIAAQCAALAGTGKEAFGGTGSVASQIVSIDGNGLVAGGAGATDLGMTLLRVGR